MNYSTLYTDTTERAANCNTKTRLKECQRAPKCQMAGCGIAILLALHWSDRCVNQSCQFLAPSQNRKMHTFPLKTCTFLSNFNYTWWIYWQLWVLTIGANSDKNCAKSTILIFLMIWQYWHLWLTPSIGDALKEKTEIPHLNLNTSELNKPVNQSQHFLESTHHN